MSISNRYERTCRTAARGSALLAACLVTSAPLAAQVQQPSPNVEDIATTPLSDLNINTKDIPDLLVQALVDPYASAGLTTCSTLIGEITRLNEVLGEDYDAYAQGKGGIDVGRAAQSLVGSVIPFRGLVREVSGAASKERGMQAAIMAGMVRRGFLKGIGQQRKCKVPARPRPRPPEPTGTDVKEAGKE
ncbi:MAG: hypothetical protein ACK4IB_07940 [Erythrobacter sp.]